MRANNMADFWTRCGTLRGTELMGLTQTWHYDHGAASFDGSKWQFWLQEGVRA